MRILAILESFTLFKDYLDSNGVWRGVADDWITEFKSLVASGKIKGEQKDINYWRKRPVDEFRKFIQTSSGQISKKTEKRATKKGETVDAGTIGEYRLIIPVSQNASAIYGAGTRWCTAGASYSCKTAFARYQAVHTAVAYLIPVSGADVDKWGLLFNTTYSTAAFDAFDTSDKFHSREEFESITGLNGKQLAAMMSRVEAERLKHVVKMAQGSYEAAYEYVSKQGGNPEDVKDALVVNVRGAATYLRQGGKDMQKIFNLRLPDTEFLASVAYRKDLITIKATVPKEYWPAGLDSV